jgi:peptidoglycan/LPS O-acetylase OafA/YrhL
MDGNVASYRPELDGLRAIAVIVVIVNHFHKELLPSGYLGVDIFFLLSGFVITSSLAGRPSTGFRDFIAGFYVRRIKRLLPALLAFVVLSSVLICLFNPEPGATLKTGITSLFGFSNLYFYRLSTDYFAQSTELNVFTHTWSLGVEEQFYFLFPLLVWLTGFSRLTRKGSRNLVVVVGAMSIGSLLIFLSLYRTNEPAAYFLMPSRFWELGAGCMLFLSLRKPTIVSRATARIPPMLVLVLIAVVLSMPLQLDGSTTVLIVALSALLIACVRQGTLVFRILTHPRVVYVGLISYPLYLWHWGVLSLSRWTVGIHWWSAPIQAVIIMLLAITSYEFLETPLRRSNWSAVRWRSIAYGLTASTVAAILIFSLDKIPGLTLYTGRVPRLESVGIPSLTDSYSPRFGDSEWKGKACVLSDDSESDKKILVENCTLGNFSTAKRRVLVLGNSFSASFVQGFDELVRIDRYAITITSSYGASPVPEVSKNGSGKKINAHYWNSVAPSLIRELRPGDWVFLINELEAFSPKNRTSEVDQSLSQLRIGLDALSSQLSGRGIRLAVLHGIPFASEANCQPASASKQWFTPFGGPCRFPGRRTSLLRRKELNEILSTLERARKVKVVDLFDIFCPRTRCTYNADNGELLYRDEHSHPSVEAARLSSPVIRGALTSP